MAQSLAPPPARWGTQRVIAPSVERVSASLRFDVAAREGVGVAEVVFCGGAVDGLPALDLRQELQWVRLDGQGVSVDDFAHRDLGAGSGAAMRVLDVEIEAGSSHVLEVGYRLGTPDSEQAEPVGWGTDGVDFDLWMSDLYPGRYLEMWVPAPLVHDRFALHLDIAIDGTDRAHCLIANTAGIDTDGRGKAWRVVYPAAFTALSPMLVIAPVDEMEIRRRAVTLPGRSRSLGLLTARRVDTDVDLADCEADIGSWLAYLASRYSPWVHGDTFSTVVWSHGRGMEYDGATTASVRALEHEVFHSWFGRGVKPARAADGWIDEAYTVWSTASRPQEGARFAVAELGLDQAPVELYPPHPWSRHTAVEAYTKGAELFAGIAHLLGGADRLRAAMASWYRVNAGKLVTTDGLGTHLTLVSGIDLGPWWARYVHGRA